MEWTEEVIARLQELWRQGLSTAEIGRQLSITKNAVVGKAHRLGLPPRPSPIRKTDRPEDEPARSAPAGSPPKPAAKATRKAVSAKAPAPSTTGVAPAPSEDEGTGPVASMPPAPPSAPEPAPADPVVAPRSPFAAVAAPEEMETATVETMAPAETIAASLPKAPAPAPAKETERRKSEADATAAGQKPVLRSIIGDNPIRKGPTCCWPIGDPGTPGFHFCGAKPLPGKPYCAEHAALAYVKLRDRRDNVA
jgi:GcrA cell cycle regulator